MSQTIIGWLYSTELVNFLKIIVWVLNLLFPPIVIYLSLNIFGIMEDLKSISINEAMKRGLNYELEVRGNTDHIIGLGDQQTAVKSPNYVQVAPDIEC